MSTSADTVGDTTVTDRTPENPYAGQGPVLLDIGGDVGALVVQMPAELDGLEVELRPAGATQQEQADHSHDDQHGHHHHGDGPHHDGHAEDHPHAPHPPHHPHVAVVGRPVGDTVVHSLVYPDVVQGAYELYPIPAGPVVMTTVVNGGSVTHARWPDQA